MAFQVTAEENKKYGEIYLDTVRCPITLRFVHKFFATVICLNCFKPYWTHQLFKCNNMMGQSFFKTDDLRVIAKILEAFQNVTRNNG